MAFFGKQKETGVQVIEIKQDESYMAFSTPFQKIPAGNLSTPFVWDRYQTRNYVPFGNDNLYPQYLNQMYYTSPLHGSIVDFKVQAAVGGGYELDDKKLTAREKVDLYTFKSKLNLDNLIEQITQDRVIHERNYFIVTIKSGKAVGCKRVGSEKVRTNKDKTIYTVTDDWTQYTDLRTYAPYKKGVADGTYILCFESESIGQDIYPLPKYTSAMNYAFLSGEMSYLAKSNIQNAVFPSFAMMFPKKPQSKEEMDDIQKTVNKLKGAENAGKAVGFFANTKEQLPELVSIPTNQNDKLFKEASELVTEQICFSHTIDPILLGVRTTGALGNGSDIKQAYVIFEKNVILPLRAKVEHILNTLLALYGINAKVAITNYQIINEVIVEVDQEGSATLDALNSMSPLVATKVLESMTTNEIRSLAALGGIKGGDITRSEAEGIAPNPASPAAGTTASPATPSSNAPETLVNDNLKGLSAKENMDIIRIVRDFNKGKLNEPLARTRLAAYGLDADTITEILEL